jgi:hypothetical protein
MKENLVRYGDDCTPQQRTNMCTCFLKQAVVTPPEDGLSISRNICRGFLSNILKNILVFFE